MADCLPPTPGPSPEPKVPLHTWPLLLITLVGLPSAAIASDAIMPAGEYLQAEIPEGWQRAVDRQAGHLRLTEYYPSATITDWHEKITIEALSGRDLPDPITYIEGLVAQQQPLCGDFAQQPIYAGFENGFATAVHLISCGRSLRTGRGLLTFVKVVRGNQALYTISRIWRAALPAADGTAAAPAAEQAQLAAWSNALRTMQVCDPQRSAHPCGAPSPSAITP